MSATLHQINVITASVDGAGVIVTKTSDKYSIKGRDGETAYLYEEDIMLAYEAINQLNRYNKYLKEDFDNAP